MISQCSSRLIIDDEVWDLFKKKLLEIVHNKEDVEQNASLYLKEDFIDALEILYPNDKDVEVKIESIIENSQSEFKKIQDEVQRAEAEKIRAEADAQRAEAEKIRAEADTQRAKVEKIRAEADAQKITESFQTQSENLKEIKQQNLEKTKLLNLYSEKEAKLQENIESDEKLKKIKKKKRNMRFLEIIVVLIGIILFLGILLCPWIQNFISVNSLPGSISAYSALIVYVISSVFGLPKITKIIDELNKDILSIESKAILNIARINEINDAIGRER